MQPFIEKLYQSSGSETETATSAQTSHIEDSLQRVDTALLSTSRLIFKEAIAAFYENNVIYLDAEHCEAASIVSPRATDLSLATQVMMKITGWYDDTKSLSAFCNGMKFAQEGLPAVFPKLRTATLYISLDRCKTPVHALFAFADRLYRSSYHDDVVFEGVGSFTARSGNRPRINYFVQCKKTVERWANEEPEFSWQFPFDLSTRSRYPYSQDGHVHLDAIRSFNAARRLYLPRSYPEVAEDSFEFWTIVDEEWRKKQLTMQHMPIFQNVVGHLQNLSVPMTIPTTQPNGTSSEMSSGSELGGQNDASDSFEQKSESESDSAENDADDQASQVKS